MDISNGPRAKESMHTGRSVVITGGGGGLGSQLVRRFLANGDTVIAADMSTEALDKLEKSERLLTHETNVAEEKSCNDLAAFAVAKTGRVDVLITCAGYAGNVALEDLTVDEWNKSIAINLTSTFLTMKATLPLMKRNGWGRIISIGSGSIYEGLPSQIPYIASKAGLLGLVRSVARVGGSDGITVNAVVPGLFETPASRNMIPGVVFEMHAKARAIPRSETVDDVVGPVFFLASPDAEFITGQTINVDGGKRMF